MTGAVYPYLAVACPKCGARPGSPCVRREARAHVARLRALEAYEASRRRAS